MITLLTLLRPGFEGAWSANSTEWTTQYLDNLLTFDWVQTDSPAGATQWIPANGQGANLVPDAHDPAKRHAPIMFTTDRAMKMDPAYRKIAIRFREHPEEYQPAFAKAWFKRMHRARGPRTRYLGAEAPKADLIVLGGGAAIEQAAKSAGHDVQVPFAPGRTDASPAQTDTASFAALEPTADGFCNYFSGGNARSPAEMVIDRASMLTLTVP